MGNYFCRSCRTCGVSEEVLLEIVQDVQLQPKRTSTRIKLEKDRNLLESCLIGPDPFRILPDVVIRDHLLQYLSSPTDKLNLGKASAHVQGLLESIRNNLLFCQAFELLPLTRLFDRKDNMLAVHKLRSICRDWRNALDRYYSNAYGRLPDYSNPRSLLAPATDQRGSSYHWKVFDGDEHNHSIFELDEHFNFQDVATLDKFKERFGSFHGNPFLTRSIVITLDSDEHPPNPDFCRKLMPFLSRFGKELSCAEIRQEFKIREEARQAEAKLAILQECLRRMSHIQALCVSDASIGQLPPAQAERNPPIIEIDDVFPPLPNLARITLNNSSGEWAEPIYQRLSPYYDQIHTLVVNQPPLMSSFLDWHDPKLHSTFPHLQRLQLTVNNVKSLFKLREWTSPLREVKIRTWRHISLPFYFHVLEQFWSSLCAVDLVSLGLNEKAIQLEGFGLGDPETVAMTHLDILSMSAGCRICESMDALMTLKRGPSLLEIFFGSCHHHQNQLPSSEEGERKKRESILELREGFENIYASNIWELLPDLKEVKVFGAGTLFPKIYTRKGSIKTKPSHTFRDNGKVQN